MKLNSYVLIPFLVAQNFLDLKYEKIKSNAVKLEKIVQIDVHESASPLFYKLEDIRKIKNIIISGKVEIEKEVGQNFDDSYFQLGIIYEGDYRPSSFVKNFLPEWLLSVLTLSENSGVSEIEFLEVSKNRTLLKEDNIRDIKLSFKTITNLEKGEFEFEYKPKDKKILGFWLRSDGDDSKAKFNLKITKFEID